jgi:low affinity Fe/Cu permease
VERTWLSGFSDFGRWTARWLGHPMSFAVAILATVVWLVLGPVYEFNDTWQLVMATGSSAITFLMIFLLQSSQNRESQAMQLKLDEVIRALKGAENALVSAEKMSVEELDELSKRYAALAENARQQRDLSEHLVTVHEEVVTTTIEKAREPT